MKYPLLKKVYESYLITINTVIHLFYLCSGFREVGYNTVLPSSASEERLFSQGGQILKPTLTRLTNSQFESLLFMCVNSDLSSLA